MRWPRLAPSVEQKARPNSANACAQTRPMSAELWPIWTNLAKFAQSWPELGKIGLKFGQIWPNLAEASQTRAKFGPNRSMSMQTWANLAVGT